MNLHSAKEWCAHMPEFFFWDSTAWLRGAISAAPDTLNNSTGSRQKLAPQRTRWEDGGRP